MPSGLAILVKWERLLPHVGDISSRPLSTDYIMRVLVGATACAILSLWQAVKAANPRPYPPVDAYLQTTNFLDHAAYLEGFDDKQFYLDTIPFIDIPDQQIQDVYYYRMSVIKRHIKLTYGAAGWIATEYVTRGRPHLSNRSCLASGSLLPSY